MFYPVVNASNQEGAFIQYLQFELIVLPVKLLYAYITLYGILPQTIYRKKYVPFFTWVLLLGAVAGITVSYLDIYVIYPLLFDEPSHLVSYPSKIIYKVLDQMQVVAFVVIIKIVQRQLQQEKSSQLLSQQKVDAELKLLKNQLQPHFLFNTLNNLYGMVLTKDEHAPEIILKLSDLLSYMLYECNENLVLIEKEVLFLKNYISIEKIRYGKKADIYFDADINQNIKVAPLLFFPLLENAFKHGPGKLEKKSSVDIKLVSSATKIEFQVRNARLADDPEKKKSLNSGIGHENVQARLNLLYPDSHSFETKEQDQEYIVSLTLYNEL